MCTLRANSLTGIKAIMSVGTLLSGKMRGSLQDTKDRKRHMLFYNNAIVLQSQKCFCYQIQLL